MAKKTKTLKTPKTQEANTKNTKAKKHKDTDAKDVKETSVKKGDVETRKGTETRKGDAKAKDIKKVVEEEAKKLLELLKVKAELEVKEDKENEAIAVQLSTDEPGILIGYHGETLASFQLILSLIVNQKFEDWTRILVNVNDYRQKREESLKMIALNAAQKVKFSGEEVVLTNLSAGERRIIHLALADHPDVTSVSEGQGGERRLVVRPR